MPTNQQRRDAAKRKLERQLQRREEQDRARRQRLVIVGVIAAVLVISGGVWLFVSQGSGDNTAADTATDDIASSEPAAPETPCTYPASGTAAKEVTAPTNLEPLNSGTADTTIVLNGQDVPITLNRELAPCGVNSFLSLASQGFYNETTCHRLTKSEQLNVLQCGDPTGKGNGGPGYSFATEVATDATYPVGTVALANAGPDTSGSQFFVVYGATTLSPPEYTILGTVTGDGMNVIDEIATQGVQKGAQDGPPVATVTIDQVNVPDGALEGTGTYVTASPSEEVPTDGLSPDGAVDTGGAAPTDAATPTAEGTAPSDGAG